MMLAVLSAAAQEESHTKSEIMNISIEQRFSRGIFLTPKLLGYDKDEDGNLVINETEADTVRLCYYLFLSGFPTSEIAEILMDLGRKTKLGNKTLLNKQIQYLRKNQKQIINKHIDPVYINRKKEQDGYRVHKKRNTRLCTFRKEVYRVGNKEEQLGEQYGKQ